MHLQPRGILCGGHGTPLPQTWLDLGAPNQVLYGLNGAGKTTVLESLHGALCGRAGGGQVLARLPVGNPGVGWRLSEPLSMILTSSENFELDHAHEIFVAAQCETLQIEFDRRLEWCDWDIPESRFDDLDWSSFIGELGRSLDWLFTPIGNGEPRWSVSPVVLVKDSGRWAEHLTELTMILEHDSGPLGAEMGLEPLWWDAPKGAPTGIVGTMVQRSTGRGDNNPWWPFGQVVSDDDADAGALTRRHLATHPRARFAAETAIERGTGLDNRIHDLERRANVAVADLLDGAPALHLALGDDSDWFKGLSCTWTATRFDGDQHMDLARLSSAEQRWSGIAIRLAIADELNASYDRQFAELMEGLDEPAYDALEGSATTWLLLDEPERGLHRTAETHMARGIVRRTELGVRSVLATHSPDLLDHGAGEVHYVRRRSHDRPGAVLSMQDFNGVRQDLGLNPSDMLRRTRGIALVEGEHDLRIFTAMIGTDLARLGVVMLPLRGAGQLRTATESRFLYEFTDALLFPVLDDLALSPLTELWDRHVADARTKPASEVSDALRSDLRQMAGKGGAFLEEFLSTAVADGLFERVQPLGIPQSDVLECLPVRAFVPDANSWADVREAARRGNGGVDPSETKFKQFLIKVHRADLSPEHLERLARTNPAHPDVKALLAAIDERLGR